MLTFEFFIPDYRTGIIIYKIVLNAKKRVFTQDQSIESHWTIIIDIYNNIGVKLVSMHFNENSLLDFAGDMVSNIIKGFSNYGFNYSDIEQNMSFYTIHYESIDLSQDFPMDEEEDSIIQFKVVHRVKNYNNPDRPICNKILEFYMTYSLMEDFILFIERALNELNFQNDNGSYFTTAGIWEE